MADALTDELKLRYRITRAVRQSSALPSPAKLIMMVLADVAEVGTAEIPSQRTPSVAVLAHETGLNRRTIQRHMDALVASGWVARSVPTASEMGRRERMQYRLLLPDVDAYLTGGTETPVAEDHPTGGTESQDGRQETTSRAAESPTTGGTEPPPYRSTDEDEILEMFEMHIPEPSPKAKPQAKRKRKPPPVAEDDPDFVAFWAAYPKRVGKGDARQAWPVALEKTSADEITASAQRWATHCRDTRKEDQFIPHPTTWLNRESWADELPATNGRAAGPFKNPEDQHAAYASGGL